MKRAFIGIIVLLALAGAVELSQMRLGSEARAQGAVTPQKLLFDKGIGFYVLSDGQLTWLAYPTTDRDKVNEETGVVSPQDFKLYAYGIDYSHTPNGLPPHLNDFGVVLYTGQYYIDAPDYISHSLRDRRGPYPVHFVPIAGYDQPVYEITCDFWSELKAKQARPATWGFKIKDGTPNTTPLVYWFKFQEAPLVNRNN